MILGVPRAGAGERRVALVPAVGRDLLRQGFEVLVEAGAGVQAGFADDSFVREGVGIVTGPELFERAEIVLTLPDINATSLHAGQTVIGLLDPLGKPAAIEILAEKGVTAFALELLPRITRAQAMDALTSMATVAGYKAVLLAANRLDKLFPLLMTAAGTVVPARVLVIGAGVAGLQAIATAHRLGAVVQAYDVRPEVREQVESLGAKYTDLGLSEQPASGDGYARPMDDEFYRGQQALLQEFIAQSDVVITTAALPGARAPELISAAAVRRMRSGSVIVDLAVESGGNCPLTQADAEVIENGVTILGPRQLAASVPHHASQLYAKNLAAFVLHFKKAGAIRADMNYELLRETLVALDGKVVHPKVRDRLAGAT